MTWEETKAFLAPCFPEPIAAEMELLMPGELREIRVRAGQKVVFCTAGRNVTLPWSPDAREVETLADALCEHGLYARGEELRQGYVTLRGGHRMGLCGRVLRQDRHAHALQDIGSVCIRVALAWEGCANVLLPLCLREGSLRSLLIIGAPGTGKTTLLRDVSRQLSMARPHRQLAVVDERGEIAACVHGVPQLDVGACDVLDGCPKAEAFSWLIRSMAPEMIVTDELAGAQEAAAVAEAVSCGVAVLASAHGASLRAAAARPEIASLMAQRLFDGYAVLASEGGGRVAAVYDRCGSPVEEKA